MSKRTAAMLGIAAALTFPTAAGAWAPAATAPVHPGVAVDFQGNECSAGFVFTTGTDVALGIPASCAGAVSDPCTSGTLPLGTQATVSGATRPATLVYSSFLTMQANGETDPDVCAENDFALLRLDPVDVSRTNPSVPVWGGPTAVAPQVTATQRTFGYAATTGAFTGIATPALGSACAPTSVPPSDAGALLLDTTGRALGQLTAATRAATLTCGLGYATAHGQTYVLANGTEPFSGRP